MSLVNRNQKGCLAKEWTEFTLRFRVEPVKTRTKFNQTELYPNNFDHYS